jgi:hypothetical protein
MTDASPSPIELVAALRGPSPNYKRSEMDRVMARLDDCEPALLALLSEAAEDPDRFGEREGPSSFAVIYAVHLLARQRSAAAHEPLIELLRKTDERLIGDAVTEDLGTWLYATSAGRTEGLERLARDPAVGPWVRAAAVDARAMQADADPTLREATVALLRAILEDDAEEDEEPVLTAAAAGLVDLGHVESGDLLRAVIEDGRLDPWAFSLDDIASSLTQPGAPGEYVARQLEHYLPQDDPHCCLAGWAAFEENGGRSLGPAPAPPSLGLPAADRKAPTKKVAAKKKSRRKAQKKARAKQRKRR